MEAAQGPPPPTPFRPDTEIIKRRLLRKGVVPTPKIVHALRKKEMQKHRRRTKRLEALHPTLSDSQKRALAEDTHFQTLAREYRAFTAAAAHDGAPLVGRPWESLERSRLLRDLSGPTSRSEYVGERLRAEPLRELGQILQQRRHDLRRMLLDDADDGVEFEEEGSLGIGNEKWDWSKRQPRSDADAISLLIHRLSCAADLSMKDWKFTKIMKYSGLQFTEDNLLKLVEELGDKGLWRHAISVVEWVYSTKGHGQDKCRFVFTKLLAVLGKAMRPQEALRIFNLMRGDCHVYPDMPAYHSIAVTLGQAGLLKPLVKIIDSMRQKPSKKIKNLRSRHWDPSLEPDVVVFNAVLNACVPSQQWKGVFWVFRQMRKNNLEPNGATYGLAMEVMLNSGKYDFVHQYFEKMQRSGVAIKGITYKVLVKTYRKEGKVDEAVGAVRDMENKGVIGTASVYYELACCLCNHGRWQQALVEVEKLKRLPHAKQLEITFTGMIMSARDGGHVDDCISIFEHMKDHCGLNIGTINVMLKVYGRHDMFSKAKELFEESKRANLLLDVHSYSTMLEACARAAQWEYFEYVYREMTLSGYQLDQNKDGSLLVEASRAGKCHLLEHAFDLLLEAEEIPHSSFFIEMLCQAIVQRNHKKAIALINSIAYAPFQVTEEQWTDVFLKNRDRICSADLEKLSHVLQNSDVAVEASATNLTRSLQYLCGSSTPKDFSGSIVVGNEDINKSRLEDNSDGVDKKKGKSQNFLLTSMPRHGSNAAGNLPVHDNVIKFDVASLQTSNEGNDANVDELLSSLCKNGQRYALDDPSHEWSTSVWSGSLEHVDKVEVEHEAGLNTDWNGSSLPSADEILAAWKRKGEEG